jgi:hypothetical protein
MFLRSHRGKYFAGGLGSLRLLVMTGFAGIMMSTGCVEVSSSPIDSPAVDAKNDSNAAPAPAAPPATTPTAATGDALDLARVTNFFIPSSPGVNPDKVRKARVTAKITAASTDGDKLYTSYDRYSFPNNNGADAIAYFFYVSGGTVMGGKFDWWRTGGQSVKTLENVHLGYGGHRMPAKGTECWTMISSVDGSQRSNTCKVEWK